MLRMVEIGPEVLVEKISKFRQCIFAILLNKLCLVEIRPIPSIGSVEEDSSLKFR